MRFVGALSLIGILAFSVSPPAVAVDTGVCGGQAPFHDAQAEALFGLGMNLAGYKSDAKVDRYVACWASPSRLKAYNQKYKHLVKHASEVTGVPYSILACNFFKESLWDPNAVSPVGAVGLAQLMTPTLETLKNYLNGTPGPVNPYVPNNLRKGVKRDGGALDRVTAEIEKLYHDHFRHGAIRDRKAITKLNSLLHAYKKLKNPDTVGDADAYLTDIQVAWKKIDAQRMYAEYFKAIGRRAPKTTDLSPKNPEEAIILGAINLEIGAFRSMFEKDGEHRSRSQDRWIIAIGATNIGPGNMKCGAEMTANECIAITKTEETKKHMTAVRNCSEQGNGDPMPPQTHGKCEL
jgi:hypothetical protein